MASPMSYASVARASASAPPVAPAARMAALKNFYATKSQKAVFFESLASERIAGYPDMSSSLVDYITVVGIDTEAWTRNTSKMTEIGLATFDRADMQNVYASGQLGDFGENLMKCIKFYHFRIIEHAHMTSRDPGFNHDRVNRFGQTRFITFAEAKTILQEVFARPINPNRPELGNRPVVFLGHALNHDESNMKRALDFDINSFPNVVAWVDTQQLAKDTGFWTQSGNVIGLSRLTERLGFEHSDAHTACNDIGRTIISAVQMALHEEMKKKPRKRTMQNVADAIESYSQANFRSSWGTPLCCIKCGSRNHTKNHCWATVRCEYCATHQPYFAGTHVQTFCPHEAEADAIKRREEDASRKAREIAEGKRKPKESRWRGKGRARGKRGGA